MKVVVVVGGCWYGCWFVWWVMVIFFPFFFLRAVFDRKVVGNSCIPRVGIFVGLFLIEKSLEIAA